MTAGYQDVMSTLFRLWSTVCVRGIAWQPWWVYFCFALLLIFRCLHSAVTPGESIDLGYIAMEHCSSWLFKEFDNRTHCLGYSSLNTTSVILHDVYRLRSYSDCCMTRAKHFDAVWLHVILDKLQNFFNSFAVFHTQIRTAIPDIFSNRGIRAGLTARDLTHSDSGTLCSTLTCIWTQREDK